MILHGRQLHFLVVSPVLPSIINVIVIDRAPEEGRLGPVKIDGLVGLASQIQDQGCIRSSDVGPAYDLIGRLALVLPRVSLHPDFIFGLRFYVTEMNVVYE